MKKLKQLLTPERLPVVLFALLFVAVLITFQALQPAFLSLTNLINIAKSVSTTVIAAVGLTFVITTNRSDISFYMAACFSAELMAWLVSKHWHPVMAILAGTVSGLLWGAISGVAVGIAGIPLPVYIMAVIVVLSYFLLERSKFGRGFYAVGATERTAYLSGINVNLVLISAYVICGVLAAIAAMIMTARQGYGNVKITMSILTPCFTAVYIGKSVFKRPCVIGTFLGALLVTVISTGLTGIVLIVAILLSGAGQKTKVRRAKGGAAK